jgi:hypothetical protein
MYIYMYALYICKFRRMDTYGYAALGDCWGKSFSWAKVFVHLLVGARSFVHLVNFWDSFSLSLCV